MNFVNFKKNHVYEYRFYFNKPTLRKLMKRFIQRLYSWGEGVVRKRMKVFLKSQGKYLFE